MAGKAALRLFASVAVAAGAVLVGGVVTTPAANAASSRWIATTSAKIRPGNQVVTGGSQCTSNFVFTNGNDVLIGMAAHCAGTTSEVNGCKNPSLPLGTPVSIEGAAAKGTLVYSSWATMQAVHEPNTNACNFNDFALVKINAADVPFVNPTVPHWGGPTGVATEIPGNLKPVFTYGNSSLRLGLTPLSPKRGWSLGAIQGGAGWTFQTYTITPGIPGDSGSGFMNKAGQAVGVLSTLQTRPLIGSNGVGNLNFEMIYARGHGFPGLQLALGTLPFKTSNNNA